MRKKFLLFFSILFVALLVLQSVVSIFVYDAQLKSIRKKFKWNVLTNLPDSELSLIKVAKSLEAFPNEIFIRKQSDEFQFMGEMYDILHQIDYKDTTYYYCFHDSEESEVIHRINKWMHDHFGNQKNQSQKGKILKDTFKKNYLASLVLQVFLTLDASEIYIPPITKSSADFMEIFSPPPEKTA